MGKKTKLALLALPLIALLGTLGYVAAGPYLAINGIRRVAAGDNLTELRRFVDFNQLRSSVGPQIRERIARELLDRAGAGEQPQTLAEITTMISQRPVDAIASPEGIQHLLRNNILSPASGAGSGPKPPSDPLKSARTRFESASLFTASVPNAQGKPLVFEFRRQGLSWKMTGIRLPEN